MSQWFVYIVRCADNTLYTGVTTDLTKRIDQHNSGKGAKYTRARGPVKLLWSAKAKSEGAAKRREAAIKKLSRADKNDLISSKKG